MRLNFSSYLHRILVAIKLKSNKSSSDPNQITENLLFNQVLVALGPLILTICSGMTSGYSAILLPQLQNANSTIQITSEEASWIASMAAFPMAFGCIFGGWLLQKTGRKSTHLISVLPICIGWLLIYFATNVKYLLAGRFLTGFPVGVLGASTGVYIAETSSPKYRGFLLGAISFAISLGLFLVHLIGTFIDWQTTALISSLLPLFSVVLMAFVVPESPAYYANHNEPEKARKAFIWCRGTSEEATRELDLILERQNLNVASNLEIKSRFLVPQFLKPLGIIVVYIVANQWAGVNAVSFYTVSIMKNTIGVGLNEYAAMLIVDAIRVLASVLACVLLRKFPRRPLAITSGVGTFASLVGLSAYTYSIVAVPELSQYSSIPMLCLVSYICFTSIGFVPLPWAMIGEVFPLNSRNVGSGIASFMAFAAFFSVVKTSPSLFDSLGTSGTFLLYGVVAFLGTVFVALFLPETRNKPLHEIEEHFKSGTSGTKNTCRI